MAYLIQILQKYQARDLSPYSSSISLLKNTLYTWASSCYLDILDSGSRAKGTAISLASDVDYLVSLSSSCNENSGGLEGIYDSLNSKLSGIYTNVRKQNVSIRLNLGGLLVDVTPARKQLGNTNDHWLYVSKLKTRKQTNIKKHISDISASGRTNEIKILKVWRELHKLEFPSVYLEYLVVNNILRSYPTGIDKIGDNVWHVFNELAKYSSNPLDSRLVDPANSANILSDLLSQTEKNSVKNAARSAIQQTNWNQIVW
ncbi:hypothetical protein A2313_04845 [Candidatus Roizmanbacteria bacterium RIFOXYB2_FULL_41_10]|uniref:Polymerase nucleotidyl transferase domain-containing protein n=1 Tax=Candidatus Roizmanbacteria bacterium RIFOXYA1_FULL_41_12 TaxID=1802082 RepID=A0A1F7K9H1_9BACT|nr:MAG: hypothetical protein A2209_02285 [Candidatus Roizmanbacteria bacterium RIFOXYA1_FULL_41_12]OGK68021.1 MAG: hypothetical protein A2377_03970 [Candidatus Roizmanbacteria bacterium RIFOXYB1_FULL_41_27]OGK69175.1 MAG: hypothetical protein A2313_04845 [Candidatus Roizmanbacteria bacterium RIFOXYB2_FULL_41_10]OGK72221.1 MAG: hypothetical protein A2403_04660 [Candidatus Roizmanbacteria bacterium RIFOXYC1_FULL_41_16]OGK75441.1 MAG: hypothetical protein A2575_04190 [Candidatus Roizmanbacteria ba